MSSTPFFPPMKPSTSTFRLAATERASHCLSGCTHKPSCDTAQRIEPCDAANNLAAAGLHMSRLPHFGRDHLLCRQLSLILCLVRPHARDVCDRSTCSTSRHTDHPHCEAARCYDLAGFGAREWDRVA